MTSRSIRTGGAAPRPLPSVPGKRGFLALAGCLALCLETGLAEEPEEGIASAAPLSGAPEALQPPAAPAPADWRRHLSLWDEPESWLVQSLALSGRIQIDYTWLDAGEGSYRDWDDRRTWFGFKGLMLDGIEFRAEADFDFKESDPLYTRLTEVSLRWRISDSLALRAGKQGTGFTVEGATTSTELITVERSGFTHNLWFPSLYIPGAALEFRESKWRGSAGVFTGGSATPEFGNFDGSAFGLLKVSRDISETLGGRESLLSLHYVYQDPDPNNSFTRPHQHVASLNLRHDAGPWGIQADVAGSRGYGGSADLAGLMLMPYLNFGESWQLVGRWSCLESSEPGGLRHTRYDNQITGVRGDAYQDYYLGVNRYFQGHQLKWQAGLKRILMENGGASGGDYASWGLTTGIRISW